MDVAIAIACLLAPAVALALASFVVEERARPVRPADEAPVSPRRAPLPSNALPTRADVRAACERATAASPCHDGRCPARGRHRCHDLDCRTHRGRL